MKSNPLLVSVFQAWHCDHFGHVNTRAYAGVFDDAITAFWAHKGTALTGIVPVTAQMLTRFQAEATAGMTVHVHASVKRVGDKSVTLDFSMADVSGKSLAICEVIEVFFDLATRNSAAIPLAIRGSLSEQPPTPVSAG